MQFQDDRLPSDFWAAGFESPPVGGAPRDHPSTFLALQSHASPSYEHTDWQRLDQEYLAYTWPTQPVAASSWAGALEPHPGPLPVAEPIYQSTTRSQESQESPTASPRPIAKAESQGRRFHCIVPGCHKNYARKGDLKTHVTKFHADDPALALQVSRARSSRDGKPFACPFPGCPSGFHRKGDLRRHVRSKHEKASEDEDELSLLPEEEEEEEEEEDDDEREEAEGTDMMKIDDEEDATGDSG